MLFAYTRIVIRQLLKSKAFLLINLSGLAIALSASLIIWQFANYHLNYDSFYPESNDIYRVACHIKQGDLEDAHTAALSATIGPAATEQFPEVSGYGRFWSIGYMNHSLIHKEDTEIKMFSEKAVYLADRSSLEMFNLKFKHGHGVNFEGKGKMILSASSAIKYFGSSDPVGLTVELASNMGSHSYEIVGVVEDLPGQTHIQFDLLLSFDSHRLYYKNSAGWQRFNTMNYLVIQDPEGQEAVADGIQRMLDENVSAKQDQGGYEYEIYLEGLTDIHTTSKVSDSFKQGTDSTLIYALLGITLVILVIAWINYLNLGLVRAVDRIREIGVRRVFGADNSQLAVLFVLESLVVNLVAFALALTLAQLSSPYLSQLTDVQINIFQQPEVLVGLLLTVVIGALFTGLYPMTLLRVLKTSEVLTGRKAYKVGKFGLRHVMILLQFTITFVLVAGTLTIYKQVSFMKSADLGINIDDTLIIKSPPSDIHQSEEEGQQAYNLFKSDLANHSVINAVTNAGEAPGEPISWRATAVRLKNAPENNGINTSLVAMGLNFREFFDIELLAGRWYREGDSPWRKKDCVINMKLAERLGFERPEDVIGAEISGFFAPVEVRGVVENYHHESLHADYDPVMYILSDWTEYYFVRLNIDKSQQTEKQLNELKLGIATVERAWNQAFITPMDYSFLDQKFNRQYFEDERLGKIFGTFAMLAVFIASMGLYGMFSFSLRQKVKEIGIRKVLGARLTDLTKVLSLGYFKILMFAYVLAVPMYLYVTGSWLESFTFRIALGAWIFWIPLGIVSLIFSISIALRLLKSVRANPINSLRCE